MYKMWWMVCGPGGPFVDISRRNPEYDGNANSKSERGGWVPQVHRELGYLSEGGGHHKHWCGREDNLSGGQGC